MNKDVDEFDLAAQRLARAWRRTALAPWSEVFSPLDSALVMQNALSKQRRRGAGGLGMSNVMRQFLNDISDIENMATTFQEDSMYDWSLVPQWVQQERPLLLDPVNPWRNPFSGVQRNVFGDISRQARESLKIMDRHMARMNELFNVPPEAVTRGA